MFPASLLLASIILSLSVAALVAYFRARETRRQRDSAKQRHEFDDTIKALGAARDAATEAQQKAESASRAQSMLLANMSHELRTPRNAIIGYSEMRPEDAADMTPGEIAADLKKITGAGKHLLSLSNDVLDCSKIEAGRMDLHLETVDVATVVKKQGNQFVVHSEDDVGTMTADPGKVRQVLLNLLSTAGKFTTNGTVSLRAVRTERHGEDFLALSVEDHRRRTHPRTVRPSVSGLRTGRRHHTARPRRHRTRARTVPTVHTHDGRRHRSRIEGRQSRCWSRANGTARTMLPPTGPAVGMRPEIPFTAGTIVLEPGETLLVLTDGITESRAPNGLLFGDDATGALLAAPADSADSLLDRVLDAVHVHAAGEPPADDVTLLAVPRV